MKKAFSILFACVTGIIFGQTPLNYLSSTIGGSTYEVYYYNNYLYAGCANTLRIYDLTGPNNTPGNLKFEHRFISNIDNLQVKNGFLYVCANHAGLSKWDLNTSPDSPVYVCKYTPLNLDESIYDIAFYGDSVFVAAKNKLNILLDSANTFTLKGTVDNFPTTSRIRGLDIKDSLLAYTVAHSANNAQDGVYLRNIKTSGLLDFYNQTQGEPEGLFFGENNKLIHVMGGNITFTDTGVYYALDYTNPTSLNLKYSKKIAGFLLLGSFSSPMNAKIINDTVYVATQGGGPIGYSFPNPFSGQVYVFDATNPNNITLLTDIYAGLYHFDIDINPATKKMYVASEWYGILTVDISNIYSEISLGKTLTGGWCHGSAKAKNKLVEASEGFGIRLFDITNPLTPIQTATDTTVGFCRAISISDSATYVYGWFLTGKRFRIHDANNLTLVSTINVDSTTISISDFEKSRIWQNKVAVIENISPNNERVVVADVSNPAAPFIQGMLNKPFAKDILFHSNGDMFVLSRDTIVVYNVNTLAQRCYVVPPLGGFQPYRAFTLFSDTLYVYYSNVGAGIAKYYFNAGAHTLTYLSAYVHPMNASINERIFMASDSQACYIASVIDSLKAFSKSAASYQQISLYNHGADFIYDNIWGVMDMYAKDGYLFLNEYMGQTSIFGPASITTAVINHGATENQPLKVFPNPTTNLFFIQIETKDESLVKIFDLNGNLVYINDFRGQEKIQVSTNGLSAGIYVVSVMSKEKERRVKLVVGR